MSNYELDKEKEMVNKRTVVILGIVCSFLLGEFAAVAEAGIAAWWKMDDGSGIIAEDSAGDANGTLVNGPVWTTGVVDGALELDGSNDYVSVPGVSGSGPVDNITFACWIYPQITSSYRAIYNHEVFGTGGVHFQITSSSTLQLAVVGTSYFYTVSTFSTNQWYHVAVVYSNSSASNYARFYINGIPESSIAVGTGAQVDLTKTALIGACDMGGSVIGRNFDGRIDDLRIYDSVLSETQIQQMVGAGSPASTPMPSDGATGVSIESELSWQPGVIGALSYDVYFDTNNPPTTLIADDITDTNVYAGPLEYGRTYYWQVDKTSAYGTKTGDVWNFSTAKWSGEPMGTAFTFQGRLLDDNAAADGLYDFQFKLFDSVDEAYGNQEGSDVNKPDVDVIDGYFTVELDFGSDVFTSEERWLEIGVRPGDSSDAYEALRPRQQLTAVPYALRTRGESNMQKQIANLQKQSYTSSFASYTSTTIEDCTMTGDGIDCQQKMIVGVDLHEGYPIILDAISDTPTPGEVLARIEIEKLWREPALTIHSFDVHIKMTMGADVHEFDISPTNAVYNSKRDPTYTGTFHIIASLVRDSRVILNIVADKIRWVTTESPGYIMWARLEYYEPSASEVQLTVKIKNDGDLRASYSITVTDHDPLIEPMVQQTRLLESQEEAELTFNVRSSEKFRTGSGMKVSMYSDRGKLYDFLWVYFP
jgi:hypothetical protein